MGKHHLQDTYKGIMYCITRNGSEYYGYLNDTEYSYTTSSDNQYEVIASIKSFIDDI